MSKANGGRKRRPYKYTKAKPCIVNPSAPCDCKPGDIDCGKLRPSEASHSPRSRRLANSLRSGNAGSGPRVAPAHAPRDLRARKRGAL